MDLVYFTTRVADTDNTSATQVLHKRHERDRSATRTARVMHEWHKCDTSEKFCFW